MTGSCGQPKNGTTDPRGCPVNGGNGASGLAGDPINTHTGGFDYNVVDMTMNTPAGPLSFERFYNSRFTYTQTYTTTLGLGWTHNHDIRLIFPDDPGGQEHRIWFKGPSGNQYPFIYIENDYDGDGIPQAYTYAYPGVQADLTRLVDHTYVLTDTAQNVYTFDVNGVLTNWHNPQGQQFIYSNEIITDTSTGITYTLPITVSEPVSDRYLVFHYDDTAQPYRLTSVSDHGDRDVIFTYTANNELETVVDVTDQTWEYQYEALLDPGYLTKVFDPEGRTTVHTAYNDAGQAIAQYDANGDPILEIQYNLDGTTIITDTIDGAVYTTTHLYNGRNILVGTEDALHNDNAKVYTASFRPGVITDTRGYTTTLYWNVEGTNLNTVFDAGQNRTDMDYDTLNNLTSVIDPRGYLTTYGYEGTQLITSTNALDATTIYTYTVEGYLTATQDPLGHVTEYTYNSAGQLATVENAAGEVTAYTYDGLGRQQTVTYPPGERTDWTCYDPAGRVIRTVQNASGDGGTAATHPCNAAYQPSNDPLFDRITETYYDDSGNFIATKSPAGVVTRTYYNSDNRPYRVVQNLYPATVQQIYDDTPPVFNPNDPIHNISTTTHYDVSGHVIATEDVLGRITRTYYDPLGRPELVVQNLTGQAITASFDLEDCNRDIGAVTNICSRTFYDENSNVIGVTDPLSHTTRTVYDTLNRPILVVQNLTGFAVDDPFTTNNCNPTAGADTNVCTQTHYDESGNVIATVDPAGRVTRTYFDALNRPITVTQNVDISAIFTDVPVSCNWGGAQSGMDADENLCTATVYDDNGNVIATLDSMGRVTHTYYDDLNRPELVVQNWVGNDVYSETRPICNQTTNGSDDTNICTWTYYGEDGSVIATADPLGRITRTYYDELDRPYLVVQNLSPATIQQINNNTPPACNRQDGADTNICTKTVYDADGRAIATIDPLEIVTRTYFDELNRPNVVVHNLITTTTPIQTTTPPAYNENYPDENVKTLYAYDALGNQIATVAYLAEETEVITATTRTYYDELNRPYQVVQALEPAYGLFTATPPACQTGSTALNVCASRTYYDAAGNAIAMQDPMGIFTRQYYDGLYRLETTLQNLTGQSYTVETPPNRPTPPSSALPDENVRTDYLYDSASNRVQVQDPLGVVTKFEYDKLNRLTAVIENYQGSATPTIEINVRTEYTYNANSSRLTIRDANAVLNDTQDVTTFTYDGLNRLKTETDPLSHTTEYFYDAASNRVQVTDANDVDVFYTYDGLHRLEEIAYPGSEAEVTFTYDVLGRRVTMLDGEGQTTWVYDALGRPLTITDPFAAVVEYTYDAFGNRTSLTTSETKPVEYAYDLLSRLRTVTDWDEQETIYTYDPAGRTQTATLPNGVLSTFTYDPLGRLWELEHTRNSALLSRFAYTYNAGGNRVTATETMQLPPDAVQVQALPPETQVASLYADFGWVDFSQSLKQFLMDTFVPVVEAKAHTTNEAPVASDTLQFTPTISETIQGLMAYTEYKSFLPVVGNYPSQTPGMPPWGLVIASSEVLFPTDLSAEVSGWTPVQITATVPLSATTGSVVVTTPDGVSNNAPYTSGTSSVPGTSGEGTSWNTTASGTLSANTTWSQNVLVTGDVTIPAGITLTVNPGVTVFFAANSDNQNTGTWTNKAEIHVYGKLVANGTEAAPIYFTSNATTKAVGDWGAIFIHKDSTTSSLTHGVIHYAKQGVRFYSYKEGGGTLGATIRNCRLESNETGVYMDGRPGYPSGGMLTIQPNIENNLIRNNTSEGLYLKVSTGYGTSSLLANINNNVIEGNGLGLNLFANSWWLGHVDLLPDLLNNTVQSNTGAGFYVQAEGSSDTSGSDTDARPEVENNLFENNAPNISLLLDPVGTDGTQILSPVIRYNTIQNATHGLVVADTQTYDTLNPSILDNLFDGYDGTGSYAVNNLTGRTITANANYWGGNETEWDAGPQAGDLNGSVVTTSFLDSADAPLLSRLAPGTALAEDTVALYGANFGTRAITETQVITYSYDSLSRLMGAYYTSDGFSYLYQYDATGNRTQFDHCLTSQPCNTTTYTYDEANRLGTSNGPAGQVNYQYDANGNLTSEGARAYEYNSANRLINFALGEPPNTLDTTFTYNGLGDRLTQTVSGQETTYTLDLAAGLTQVLNDETYTYLYGNTRLAQLNTGTLNTEYFLPDALGSVRQIVAADGEVILVESYQPYGETLHSYGDSASPYGFAGEYTDSQSGLQYLRARYYAPGIARFLTRDTWAGEYTRSLSLNKWMYVEGNPVNFSDPNGQTPHPPNGNIAAPNVTAWLREQMEAHYKYGLELRAETQNIKIRTNAYWATLLNSCGPYPDLFKVAPNQPFRGLVNNFTVFGGTKIGYLPATTEVQHLPAQWIAQIASTAVGMPAQALGELLQETNTVNLLSMLEFAAYGLAVNYAQVKFTPTPNTIIDPDDGHNKNIVTVCGKAIDASDIGNIMFGLGGHARGFDWSVVYPSAALFNGLSGQGSGVLGPDARGATVGWWIGATQSWTTEASMCNTLNAWEWHGYHDNADQLANWTPSQVKLKSAVAFEPSSLQRVSDETYIFTELKNKLGFLPFVP